MKSKLLLILFAFFLNISGIIAQDEFTLVKEGDSAPDFTFVNAEGKEMKLSQLKGKAVWINFFATWCGPCRQELPHLQKEVWEKYQNRKDFELLVIGREHSREEVDKFRLEQKFTMPFFPDKERKIFSLYARQNIPRNFLIGKDGKIVVSSTGFTEAEFRKITEKLADLLK